MLGMDQNLDKHDANKSKTNEEPLREANSGKKSKKCNQCDFAPSEAGHLRIHLMTHTGEKPNKCNQCDFASSWTQSLKTHMKKHGKV